MSERIGEFVTGFTREFAIQAFDKLRPEWLGGLTPLEWLLDYLDGIGEENLKLAVRRHITLWDLMAADERLRTALTTDNWMTDLVDSLSPDEMGETVHAAVVKNRPQYAKIPKGWFQKSFEAYLGAKCQATDSGRT